MIKFEHTKVFNFDGAIRGMRNPLESWKKSDSKWEIVDGTHNWEYVIGENDLGLMKRLINAGTDHRKFMRQIIVTVDITAPLYWWKEFDTYKIGTVANSTSTMHKIMSKEFTDDMFSWEKLYIPDWKEMTLAELNFLRARWLETKDKKDWYCLIQMLPSSWNQTRTVTINYEVLSNIYNSRKHHKLTEWSEGFIQWIESLPYSKELITE